MDGLQRYADAAREGDGVALGELVRRTQPAVWQVCHALGSTGEEEDLVQETYLRALQALPAYRGEAPVTVWLLSIARRVCADHVRRRQRQRRLADRLVRHVAPPDVGAPDVSDDLLRGLDPDRREAFVLTQLVGLSYEAAAAVVGCPIGTIRSRVAHATADLIGAARRAAGAMTIPKDDKDWTWVLTRPCPECALAPGDVDPADVPAMTRANAAAWQVVLARPDARDRPAPDVWSPLEYGCHVRDVFRLFDERLHLMLDQDDPRFTNWDQDETAVADRYGDQDPTTVADELAEAGERIAASFAAVDADQWERPGRRSDGARFTVRTFAQYFIHDPVHHLHDVGA